MADRRASVAIAAVLLLSAGVALFWMLRVERVPHEGLEVVQPGPEPSQGTVSLSSTPSMGAVRSPSSPDSDGVAGCRVHVVSEDGAPIDGARLYARIPDTGRMPTRRAVLATTSRDGLAWLTEAPPVGLLVAARGFCLGLVGSEDLTDGDETVRLMRAAELEVHCVDLLERPVPGIDVWLSRAPIPDALPLLGNDRVPCLEEDALHGRTTDAEGTARFDYLTDGEYSFRLASAQYSPVSGLPDSILVPSEPVHVVLGELVGFVVRVKGDRVASHQVNVRGGLLVAGLQQEDRYPAECHLQELFPEELVFVALQTRGGPLPEAKLRLLLERHGIVDVEVPLVPLHEILEPRIVEVDGPEAPLESLLLSVVDASGRAISSDDYSVEIGDSLVKGMFITLSTDEPNALPAGEYVLSSWNPWLQQAGDTRGLKVIVPGSLELKLDRSFHRCVIEVVDRDGQPVSPAMITIDSEGIVESFNLVTSQLSLWLPESLARVEARMSQAKTVEITIDVGALPAGEGAQKITLVL